jgi:predicted phosphoadenosine phosphosulfate sulfurtransferase
MPKKYFKQNVFDATQERISWTFDNFERIYVSFSGGKDSTVMLHLVMDEAIKRDRRVGVLFIDLEGQYKLTIDHVSQCYRMYMPYIEKHWICLPIHLRNSVSVYQTFWVCWDKEKKDTWIRNLPDEEVITDEKCFPFFYKGMEFEEFVPEFGEWYSQKEKTACFVGIRADESLNRFRTIASQTKQTLNGKQWTTLVQTYANKENNVYNIYPIYDWKTADIWIYHAKNRDKPYNRLYDYMHKAGLTPHQMRICQPYGDDQRKGLWLFHLIEPQTWARVVTRVNGANSGALYVQEWGNINGYRKITKPPGHTWESFARLLIGSMPPKTKEHYENKILLFVRWWMERGYENGMPDEAPYELEVARKAPSWRRICKSLLRNDYWCKGIGYTQHKSAAYLKYLDLMRRRRAQWNMVLFDSNPENKSCTA